MSKFKVGDKVLYSEEDYNVVGGYLNEVAEVVYPGVLESNKLSLSRVVFKNGLTQIIDDECLVKVSSPSIWQRFKNFIRRSIEITGRYLQLIYGK